MSRGAPEVILRHNVRRDVIESEGARGTFRGIEQFPLFNVDVDMLCRWQQCLVIMALDNMNTAYKLIYHHNTSPNIANDKVIICSQWYIVPVYP